MQQRKITVMSTKEHSYCINLQWTGNLGEGTTNYRAYERTYQIEVSGKPVILGSSDPVFCGDATKYNPEELLVAAISSCHLLWYLHLCANAGVMVIDYSDRPIGKMQESSDGSGKFTKVILQPEVTISSQSNLERAKQLHHKAHEFCFIANSVNFPILCQPSVKYGDYS